MYQALFACFYQSNLSIIDVLGFTYDGDHREEPEAGIVPLYLDFTQKGRHKTSVEHRTFLGPEAVALLQANFKNSGIPAPGQPIFPISERAVHDYFARRAKTVLGSWERGNPMSPHSVRKGFRTTLVNDDMPEKLRGTLRRQRRQRRFAQNVHGHE